MKKYLYIAVILSAFFTPVQAQRINSFVSAGITASQIEGDELKGFNHFGYNAGVGALTAISSNGMWGLSVEVNLNQRGTYSRSYADKEYMADLTLNYVDIPLIVHYQDFYGGMLFGAGLLYGRLVQQPHGKILYSTFYPDTTDMTFLKNDLAVVADARFTIWRGLQLNLRWQYSLMAIKKDWMFYNVNGEQVKTHTNDCYNNAISIRLIWQF